MNVQNVVKPAIVTEKILGLIFPTISIARMTVSQIVMRTWTNISPTMNACQKCHRR